jgi:hypothetical protein
LDLRIREWICLFFMPLNYIYRVLTLSISAIQPKYKGMNPFPSPLAQISKKMSRVSYNAKIIFEFEFEFHYIKYLPHLDVEARAMINVVFLLSRCSGPSVL